MIAFDFSASAADITGSATSLTYSHTITGLNTILFVGIGIQTGTDKVSSVTFNSVAMTLVDKIQLNGAGGFTYLYVLSNPTSGAHNVAVTLSSGSNIWVSSLSYTGALQTSQPDSSNKVTTAGTTLTLSDTVVASNCWLVSVCTDFNGQSAGTGTTARVNPGTAAMGDSNAIVGTGAQSMVWTSSSGPMGGIVAAILSSDAQSTALFFGQY